MTNSRQLGGLIGPTMLALGATEALNLDMFAGQTAPVVYLDGTILFVVGLALLRSHNLWTWNWPILITLTAWHCCSEASTARLRRMRHRRLRML
jgi:hypothetical protein